MPAPRYSRSPSGAASRPQFDADPACLRASSTIWAEPISGCTWRSVAIALAATGAAIDASRATSASPPSQVGLVVNTFSPGAVKATFVRPQFDVHACSSAPVPGSAWSTRRSVDTASAFGIIAGTMTPPSVSRWHGAHASIGEDASVFGGLFKSIPLAPASTTLTTSFDAA